MTVQCPKCGYSRGSQDAAPDWQCPACGIAYKKYQSYLERAKLIAEPLTATSNSENVLEDGSVWSLVIVNLFALAMALVFGWRLVDLMLVFWIQSVVIGVSYFNRILSLERFSTKDFKINNRSVEPTPETKRQVALFFLVHFGMFHIVYAAFLLGGEFGDPRLDWDLLICGIAFAANHAYSYRYHRDLDRQGTPNIGKLMFTPYLRIVPMHLTIVFGGALGATGIGVLLFGLMKTVADALMHQAEHRSIASAATD